MTNLLLILLLVVGCESPTESESNTYDMNLYFEGQWNKIHENVQVIEIESDVFNITSELLVDSINLDFEEPWNFQRAETIVSQSEDSFDEDFIEYFEDFILIEYPFPHTGNLDNSEIFFTDMNIDNGTVITSRFAIFLRPKTVYSDNQYDENLFQEVPNGSFIFNDTDSSYFFWSDEFQFYKINEDTSKVSLERTLRYKEEYIDEELNNLFDETVFNHYKYYCNCTDNSSMSFLCYDDTYMDDAFDCENYTSSGWYYPKTRRIVHEIILERQYE